MSQSSERTVALVHRLFTEVFQKGNHDVADEILTEDFRFQYPFPGFSPGPEGIKEFSHVFHTALPGFELEINDLFGSSGHDDTRVGIRWTLRGNHAGHLLGLEPTKQYVTLSAIGMYVGPYHRLGKLSSGWLEMDTLGLLQQLKRVGPTPELLPGIRDKG